MNDCDKIFTSKKISSLNSLMHTSHDDRNKSRISFNCINNIIVNVLHLVFLFVYVYTVSSLEQNCIVSIDI